MGTKQELKEKVAEAVQTVEAQKQVIYCGPNLPNGILAQFTVFKGDGLPAYVKDLIEKNPEIEKAIVPVKDFSSFIKKLGDTTSAETRIFKSITKNLNKGV